MATSAHVLSTSMAQEIIICNLCDDRPSQRFCNNCQVNLCLDCIDKHQDDIDHQSHDIVTYENRILHQRECQPPITNGLTGQCQSPAAEVRYQQTQPLLDNARVLRTIRPSKPYKHLRRIVCLGASEAWVIGEKANIKRMNIHGSVKEKVRCQNIPSDISLTEKRELIYSDQINRTVNIIRQGKIEVLITVPKGWQPLGICYTRSRGMLVSLQMSERNKIVYYRGEEITMEIDKDEHGNHIFRNGHDMLHVTKNINGDICVTDENAKTVIVVNNEGRVRFRYNGIRARSFEPRCIVTDSLGHILVTELSFECIYILSQDCNLLRCVENCNLDTPCALSVDNQGSMWVGLYYKGNIKVIQYQK
uniref:Uncharacterized protein LOC111106714 n=1 Tax=Crassostrea virginica TaxID=6565 RepID=A0A8B8B1C6_CRAVI|nr:uncharacterized protein LOC111106714 [Crassostrea virginica]XP_022297213.1 uncharacterized protein LOC111106714 [Crassostrea virginica]